MNPWDGSQSDVQGLFTIRRSLDGELSAEYIDKEQYIGIRVGKEEFLLSISVVNEIVMLPVITYVPNSPKSVEGVINLRGTILPVINLRKMMGLHKGEVSSTTRIIICKDENYEFKVGLIVDAITFVVALLPDEVVRQSLPAGTPDAELISSVSKSGNSVKGILDLSKIIDVAADGRPIDSDAEPDEQAAA